MLFTQLLGKPKLTPDKWRGAATAGRGPLSTSHQLSTIQDEASVDASLRYSTT